MSKLNGMQIFALLSNVSDNLILESCAPLITAGGTAAGAAATALAKDTVISTGVTASASSTAAKVGFGAWVAKGGWVALVAGAIAAAGITAGAFFLGSDGFEWPTLPQGTETEETASAESESESETETETPDLSYFQFPLTSADDTTSYVSITDPYGDGRKTIEFFVLPQDKKDPELESVLKFIAPLYGKANIQIVSFKTETDYGFIYVYEKVITDDPYLNPGEFDVTMEGYRLRFNQSGKYSFSPEYDSRTCHFRCKENKTVPLTRYKYNVSLLNRAEDLLANYANMEGCELTVLYRYMDGEETINQSVESMPDFPFTIFNSYNRPDIEE